MLNHPARYAVAEGAVITPARYADTRGSAFVFERRFIDRVSRDTVLIDSKGSQLNRLELGLLDARREGGPASLIPALSVAYPSRTITDWELPHRAFDAHVRAASDGDELVVKQPWYRALRDSTAADLSPVFLASPITLACGGWDSSRKSGQLRLRSLCVSELYGVVDEQGSDSNRPDRTSHRSGARIDPLGMAFQLGADEYERLVEGQREEMSAKSLKSREAEITKARKGKVEGLTSASPLGLGAVPPQLENAYGVSVPEVLRARTYSLASLRRLRFGGTADEDVAARAALLGVLLLGMAYADADPDIRANCDVAAPQGQLFLDEQPVELDLSIDSCTAFLSSAIAALPERLAWTGQVRALIGDASLDRGAVADTDSDDA